jgi:ubiquinone/menaquinone biosynthesis C-methylase UbiE
VYNPTMNEADIQVLATIRRTEVEGESSDKATIEGHSGKYWKYCEDWSDSWLRLVNAGFITGDDSAYELTKLGRPLAEKYFAERPDHFWYYYQHYYPSAQSSKAHSEMCTRVFGKDLTQDGQSDMNSLHELIACLKIEKADKVLDLGCGAGGISEYISDETGAHVTGLDYAASAIDVAKVRTESKRDRLSYIQGDMNALEFPTHSFDKVFSLDTIYWVADIDDALSSIVRLVKPGGKLGIFIANTPQMDDSPGAYEPRGTWVAKSLEKMGLDFDAHDYTMSFLPFWPKMKEVIMDLRDDFVAEGHEVMFESFMRDADEDYLPALEAGKLRRYLYIVNVRGE